MNDQEYYQSLVDKFTRYRFKGSNIITSTQKNYTQEYKSGGKLIKRTSSYKFGGNIQKFIMGGKYLQFEDLVKNNDLDLSKVFVNYNVGKGSDSDYNTSDLLDNFSFRDLFSSVDNFKFLASSGTTEVASDKKEGIKEDNKGNSVSIPLISDDEIADGDDGDNKTNADVLHEGRLTIPDPSAEVKASLTISALVDSAKLWSGIPYKYGSKAVITNNTVDRNKTKGIDCSGYVQAVFAQLGIKLPNGSSNQRAITTKIDMKDLRPGDLVFLKGTVPGRSSTQTSHVGIVTDVSDLSNGRIKVAEASSSKGSGIHDWNLISGYHKDHWLCAGRINVSSIK